MIALLEFMRRFLQSNEVANPVIAGGAAEHFRARDGHQHGVSARASAGHEDGAWIGKTGRRGKARRCNRILHIGDAPIAREPLPVRAPIACAARVIEIEPGKAARGEEQPSRFQAARSCASWPAMQAYDQRRKGFLRALGLRILRPVEPA